MGDKNLVIIGAGTAGTMVANLVRKKLPADWKLIVLDPDGKHVYQPGLLFIPFGAKIEQRIVKERKPTLKKGVDWRQVGVERIDREAQQVVLADGSALPYEYLVIASGSHPDPDETEGLTGPGWRDTAHEFYTVDGAVTLREKLAAFTGGRLVVNVVEMPIKCPVAPLEFLFLADAYFHKKGIRDQVELVYATPLDGAFTKPVAKQILGDTLAKKGIAVEASFNAGLVDGERKVLSSWDEREVPYDLLVSVPTHKGAAFIDASGLGDDLGFVPTHKNTLLAEGTDNIFVIGDATNLPSSKAGSVAHFQAEVVVENIQRSIAGQELHAGFDGHANCFVETGFGKAMLIDFNYEVQPLPGSYPLPMVGPMKLMGESRMNHWGKLGFEWAYWHMLLPGWPMPVPHRMSMTGKKVPPGASANPSAA